MSGKRYSRVYLELTNICNRSCSFCPGTSRAPRVMNKEEAHFAIDRLRDYTDYIYFHLMGEPLTNPLLFDSIEYAAKEGIKCAVTTNGALLSRLGDRLIASGVYKVNISLHSFEEGTDGEYRKYLYDCISFADKASSMGVLTVIRLWNRGFDKGRNIDILKELRSYFQDCEWTEGQRGARIRHKLHLEYGDRFSWPDLSASESCESVFCYGLSDHFGVLSDGSVVPCCLDSDGNLTLGNIFKNDLQQILSSERAQKIKEGFENRKPPEQLCKKCGYARRFKV